LVPQLLRNRLSLLFQTTQRHNEGCQSIPIHLRTAEAPLTGPTRIPIRSHITLKDLFQDLFKDHQVKYMVHQPLAILVEVLDMGATNRLHRLYQRAQIRSSGSGSKQSMAIVPGQ
jgi:hypothetical protein